MQEIAKQNVTAGGGKWNGIMTFSITTVLVQGDSKMASSLLSKVREEYWKIVFNICPMQLQHYYHLRKIHRTMPVNNLTTNLRN